MAGASIEATLKLWTSSLRDVKSRMGPLFTQERVVVSAVLFLDGLLGNERQNRRDAPPGGGGDPGPLRQQADFGRGRWEADWLRDVVRSYVVEPLADEDAVLVIDETSFLKLGKASCRGRPSIYGLGRNITDCQIGVFTANVPIRRLFSPFSK